MPFWTESIANFKVDAKERRRVPNLERDGCAYGTVIRSLANKNVREDYTNDFYKKPLELIQGFFLWHKTGKRTSCEKEAAYWIECHTSGMRDGEFSDAGF